MNTTENLLKLSIISETNYRYVFSDTGEKGGDALNKIEYELEIPKIDFQSLIDLMIKIKHAKIDKAHYYCHKIIPFDTEAPVSVWNHFSSIEKNSLRNRGVGAYERPMYIFYVEDFSTFLILSIRNFNLSVERQLNKIFKEIV